MKRAVHLLRPRPRLWRIAALAFVVMVVLLFTVGLSAFSGGNEGLEKSKKTPSTFAGATPEAFKSGTPPLSQVYMPFKDLCVVASEQEKEDKRSVAMQEAKAVPSPVAQLPDIRPERKAEIASVTNRFDHVPATGGASAERWSAATGLPLRSDRTGEVKVRFVTSSNRLGTFEQTATTAATMVGVRFDVVGLNWKHFSYLKRMGMMLSYAELEGLTDRDVIAGMDSDALFSGDDPYGLYEAFVASTAESLAEHRSYSLRDIRFGKRLPPFLFGAEFNCMRVQALPGNKGCEIAYHKVNDQAAKWAARANVTLPTIYTEKNPFRFLNAGVFIARVWALRVFNAAAQEFMKSHPPLFDPQVRRKSKKKLQWWCDQSAMGTLYLDLLQWEFLSGAMDGAAKPLTKDMLSESVYPPMLLPKEGDGPNGLPGGIVGIEASERFVLTIGAELSERQFFRVGGFVVERNDDPERQLKKFRNRNKKTRSSVIGVRESLHRINIKPRPAVDCVGVNEVPPECAYRDAVLGIPPGTNAVVPLMWHFAGMGMKPLVAHYRGVFPWYTPTIGNRAALEDVVKTLLDAPPTRVFEVDAETDRDDIYHPVGLKPHNSTHDLSFLQVCRVLRRK